MAEAMAPDAVDAAVAGQILGISRTAFKEGVARTTIRLYEGATPLTLIEEKLEGDASLMMRDPSKRAWLLDTLRDVERKTGTTLFRTTEDAQITDGDIKEAWSHLGQGYFVGRSKKGDDQMLTSWKQKGFRQVYADILGSKAGPAMQAYGTFFRSVWRRGAELNQMRREGMLDADLEGALRRSLGMGDGTLGTAIDSGSITDGAPSLDGALGETSFGQLPKMRQDKPGSWEQVKPGHTWDSSKRFLPKLRDTRPAFPEKRGTWETLVQKVADWLGRVPKVKDPWGAEVAMANPQKKGAFTDPLQNRAAHLIGENLTNDEHRTLHPDKLDWVGAVEKTIADAQVRVTNGPETFYFRNYAEGTHMVVVEDGAIKDQYAVVTQYAPELSKRQFRGALVERVRPVSGLAPQGGPGSVGIPTQPQSQAVQTPQPGAQGETTTDGGGSQSFSLLGSSAWLNQAASTAGYSDAQTLARENQPLHNRLQAQWNAYHGSDAEKKRSQVNSIRDINTLLYGTTQHTPTPSRRPAPGHSGGEARDRGEAARQDYRRSFGTSSPPAGSPAGGGAQARTAQRKRERAWLVDWARDRGILSHTLPAEWKLEGPDDAGQMEHHVFHTGARWVKITRGVGDYFGIWPVPHQGTWDMRREEASIINYLDSVANSNALFGDDIVVHGVLSDRDGNVRLVISQPDIEGDPVDTKFIGDTMRAQGFVQLVPPSSFYRASDNTAVLDLHQENAVRVGELLLPFDVKVLHPTGALRENLERAAAAAK